MPTLKKDLQKRKSLYEKAETYLSTKDELKKLSAKNDVLKEQLREVVESRGQVLNTGSVVLETESKETQERIRITNSLRSTVSLQPDAILYIKTKFPALAKNLIEQVETIRMDRVEKAIREGKISKKDAKKIVKITESFALNVNVVNTEEDNKWKKPIKVEAKPTYTFPTKKLKVKGKIITCVTISTLAELCKRKPVTLRAYEVQGIIPDSNLRGKKSVSKRGEDIRGKRLYSVQLALAVAEVFKGISQGVRITPEQKRKIAIEFQKEKTLINTEI